LAENAASGRRQVPFLVLRAQVHRSYSIVEFAELENWIPARANRRFSMTEFTVNPNHREGSQPSTGRKSPGRTAFEPIIPERGLTYDTAFEKWANRVWQLGEIPRVPLPIFGRTFSLMCLMRQGRRSFLTRCTAVGYRNIRHCRIWTRSRLLWQSKSIKIENEGCERDASVTELKEPTTD